LLFVLILLVTVWSYLRLARPTRPGGRRLLRLTLLAVGALGALAPGRYLLLVGWPGARLDTLWWFRASSQ
jgi:hypothetical protein